MGNREKQRDHKAIMSDSCARSALILLFTLLGCLCLLLPIVITCRRNGPFHWHFLCVSLTRSIAEEEGGGKLYLSALFRMKLTMLFLLTGWLLAPPATAAAIVVCLEPSLLLGHCCLFLWLLLSSLFYFSFPTISSHVCLADHCALFSLELLLPPPPPFTIYQAIVWFRLI